MQPTAQAVGRLEHEKAPKGRKRTLIDLKPGARSLGLDVLSHAVQHSINKLHRLGCRKLSGNLDGFVDNNRAWGSRKPEQLSDSGTQNVSINRRHPIHAPVLGVIFDQLVDFWRAVLR